MKKDYIRIPAPTQIACAGCVFLAKDDSCDFPPDEIFVNCVDLTSGKVSRFVFVEKKPIPEVKTLLLPALRQYRHNNSDEFIPGYGVEEVEKIVEELLKNQSN